jgi:ACT domain-containing protein
MEMKPTMKHIVIGIHIPDRIKQATNVQQVLTDYGCSIRTRVGLHEVSDSMCAINGLLLLEMFGKEDEMDAMVKKLQSIEGVDTQYMVFNHHKKQ